MNVTVECPSCKQHYSVDESVVGEEVECASCGHVFISHNTDLSSQIQDHNAQKSNEIVLQNNMPINDVSMNKKEKPFFRYAFKSLFLLICILNLSGVCFVLSRIDELDNRIRSLSSSSSSGYNLNDVKTDLSRIRTELSSVESVLKSKVSDIKSSLNNLNSDFDISDNLLSLESEINTLYREILSIESEISSLELSINQQNKSIDSIKNQIYSLDLSISFLRSSTSSMERDIDSIKTELGVGSITRQLERLRSNSLYP